MYTHTRACQHLTIISHIPNAPKPDARCIAYLLSCSSLKNHVLSSEIHPYSIQPRDHSSNLSFMPL